MTEALFRDDAYLRTCEADIVGVTDRGGLLLNRTIFYATAGGQPGDTGSLELEDGSRIEIATTVYDDDKTTIVHVPAEGQDLPPVGTKAIAHVDWPRRYRLMRMHTALHVICAAMRTQISGCQIGAEESRIDLNMPEPPNRAAVAAAIQAAIDADYPISTEWITDAELDANPSLIKSMSVSPPRGSGHVRLVRIGEDFDLQPCGGTHVTSTGEIGSLEITKIENKGKQNRRIRVRFAD